MASWDATSTPSIQVSDDRVVDQRDPGWRTVWAATGAIDDYAERTAQTVAAWSGINGQQGGDPAKLAAALVTVTQQDNPPLRWIAGADAIATVEQKAKDLLAQVDAYRELSSNLAHDDA